MSILTIPTKRLLGNGVYAEVSGENVKLSTTLVFNDVEVCHSVYLSADVYIALVDFVHELSQAIASGATLTPSDPGSGEKDKSKEEG